MIDDRADIDYQIVYLPLSHALNLALSDAAFQPLLHVEKLHG